MSERRPHVLFVTYNGLLEPLGQRQGLAYLEALADRYGFTVLSFEKPGSAADHEGRSALKERLADTGMTWKELRYHKRPSLVATAYDVWTGVRAARRIIDREGVDLVHARGYVPAAIARQATRRSGVPYIFDVRGLMAEEYVDGGIWRAGSLPYRITKRAERSLLNDAAGIVTLTEAVVPQLRASPGLAGRSAVPWAVIPCCVRVGDFDVDEHARSRVRRELDLGDRPVLVYSGSVGTWYLLDEMLSYYQRARDAVPGLALLLLLNRDQDMARGALERAGVGNGDVRVTGASPGDVPAYLAAADVGVGFVRPSPSKVASSPTKVAEYLAAGIPVVVNTGVGDTDTLGEERAVQIVDDLSSEGLATAATRLPQLLAASSGEARELARRRFSIDEVGGHRYDGLYREVLGTRTRKGAQ